MDWQKGGSSDNVEVDSGGGGRGFGGGGGRMGLGGLIVLAILGWIFFKNPLALLDQGGVQSAAPTQSGVPAQVDPQQKAFVSAILHSTEVTWGEIFQAKGLTYVDPKLHLFSGGVSTGCGGAVLLSDRSEGLSGRGVFPAVAGRTAFFRRFRPRLRDRARGGPPCAETDRCVRSGEAIAAPGPADGRRRRLVRATGAAGRLLRRRVGQPQPAGAELAAARGYRVGPQRGQPYRRRHLATAGTRSGATGYVHSRHLGATREVVQDRLRQRQHGPVRHLRRRTMSKQALNPG